MIMPLLEVITSSGFASLLGMRHALEPDHIAAVSTLVSHEQNSFRAAWLGVCWGIGHTLMLFVVGLGLVLVQREIPSGLADVFEIMVAVMLIGLGLRSVLQAARLGSKGPAYLHRHRWTIHQHPGMPAHVHIGTWTLARRPLLIGAIHGLAGSGTLAALVLTTLPSTASRLTYMILFGLGSTAGMAALSGLLGWPLARLGAHEHVTRGIAFVVGCMSMVLGIVWGYPLVVRMTLDLRP
jgi:high-affinity nickel-transport protein